MSDNPKVTTLANKGVLTITNNTAAVPVYFIKDKITEGTQYFTFKILKSNSYALSSNIESTVTVYDNSLTRSFVLTTTPAVANVNEGETYYINVYTTEIEDGVGIDWLIDGVSATDLSTPLTGHVIINNNYANVRVATVRDRNTEGTETIVFRLLANADDCVQLTNDVYANINLLDTSPDPTYNLFSNVAIVDEGNCVMFQLETTDLDDGIILSYDISGISRSDLYYGSLVGKVLHKSYNSGATGNANVVLGIAKDRLTEGLETIHFRIYPDTNIKLNDYLYANVIIQDNSKAPVYVLTSNVSQVAEGRSVNFNLYAENVPNSTVFSYSVTGDVSSADIVGGSAAFTGTVTLLSVDSGLTGNANKSFLVVADSLTEGSENLIYTIAANASIGLPTALSATVEILDTSGNPTIDASPNVASVPENGSVKFNIITTDVAAGSVMQYTISDIADVNSHVVGASTYTTATGYFTVNNSGAANIVVNMKEDYRTEGTEFLTLTIPANTYLNTPGISTSLTIEDTSLSPYVILSVNNDPVVEGSNLVVTITGHGLKPGTQVFWSHDKPEDMTPVSGYVVMDLVSGTTTSNTVDMYVKDDDGGAPDYTEQYTFSTSANSTIYLASKSIIGTIVEKPIPEAPLPSFSVTPSVNSINEGQSVVFSIATSFVDNNTVLYWSIDGSANSIDFTQGLAAGTVVINNNSASVTFTARQDQVTEGTESFRLNLSTSSGGAPVAYSSYVSILDTSLTPAALVPTYAVSPNYTVRDEGQSVLFTVTTTNVPNNTVLYWTNSGTAGSSDFTIAANSGSFTINNNTGSINIPISADALTEGTENIALRIRTGSTGGTIVAYASTVTITDSSTTPPPAPTTPTYVIEPNALNINEGNYLNYTIYTTNVPNGTNLFWTNGGTSIAEDIFTGANNGQITITGGQATIQLQIKADAATEGLETHVLQLRTSSVTGTIVATSSTVIINDTSAAPSTPISYSIVTSATSINEGQTLSVTINTTNVPNSTTLYWALSGTINSSDITDGATNGTVVINNNTATFSIPIKSDSITEGAETFVIQLRTSVGTNPVATSATITVNDTSLNPAPTYAISASSTSINEDSSVTFVVTTTNITNNTVLYWKNTGTSVAADFTSGATSGQVLISNNSGSFTVRPLADKLTEGAETIIMNLYTDSGYTDLKATAATVTINDTSASSTSWYVSTYTRDTPAVDKVVRYYNEGDGVTFFVYAPENYVGNGTPYPESVRNGLHLWTGGGSIGSPSDYLGGVSRGNFYLTNGFGAFTIYTAKENLYDTASYETIIPNVYSLRASGSADYRTSADSLARLKNSWTTSSPDSATATATATYNTAGNITGISLTNGGSGYTTAPLVVFSAPSNTGTQATGYATISGGAVSGIVLTNPGSGYNSSNPPRIGLLPPTSGFTDGTGNLVTVSATSDVGTVNEGSPVTVTVTTTNIPDGTVFYWSNGGTANANDFAPGASSGQFTINNGVGTFTITPAADSASDGGAETIIPVITDSTGTVVTTAPAITLNDSSVEPVITLPPEPGPGDGNYTITSNLNQVEEGYSVDLTVNASGISYGASGRIFKITASGTGITPGDLFQNTLDITQVNRTSVPFTVYQIGFTQDQIYEGTEVVTFRLYTWLNGTAESTTSVAQVSVNILDKTTSYSLVAVPSETNEGTSINVTIDGTNVNYGPAGRKFRVSGSGSGITASDLTAGILQTSAITLTSLPFSFQIDISNDAFTEGNETLRLDLSTWLNGDTESTNSVAFDTVLIRDTSLTVAPPEPPPVTTPPAMGTPQGDGSVYCPVNMNGQTLLGFSSIANDIGIITGSLSGSSIWGNNDFGYSTDSDFRKAVVHAGLLAAGETASVRVTSLGYKVGFPSTYANGITTSDWPAGWCAVFLELANPPANQPAISDLCWPLSSLPTGSYSFRVFVNYPATMANPPVIQDFYFSGPNISNPTYGAGYGEDNICVKVLGEYSSISIVYSSASTGYDPDANFGLITWDGTLDGYTGTISTTASTTPADITYSRGDTSGG